MKKKNITVGDHYAIGAPPVGRYPVTPFRAKVVSLDVYGHPSGDWHRSRSSKPNYVEIEPVESMAEPALGSNRYRLMIYESEYGETTTCPRVKEGEDELIGRVVYRVPLSHVLRTWEDETERREAKAVSDTREKEENDERKARSEKILKGFEGYGYTVRTGRTASFAEMSMETAAEILEELYRLRDLDR